MAYLQYANQSATRDQPLSPALVDALSFLNNMGITMKVFSGGQPSSGPDRTGSHRHDEGNAADVLFYKDGRQLDWRNKQDIPVFQSIVEQAKQRGVTGFGAGDNYMIPGSMHIGFGTPAVWGAGGKGSNAPEWLRQAFNGVSVDSGTIPPASPMSPTSGNRPELSPQGLPAKIMAAADTTTQAAQPTQQDLINRAVQLATRRGETIPGQPGAGPSRGRLVDNILQQQFLGNGPAKIASGTPIVQPTAATPPTQASPNNASYFADLGAKPPIQQAASPNIVPQNNYFQSQAAKPSTQAPLSLSDYIRSNLPAPLSGGGIGGFHMSVPQQPPSQIDTANMQAGMASGTPPPQQGLMQAMAKPQAGYTPPASPDQQPSTLVEMLKRMLSGGMQA